MRQTGPMISVSDAANLNNVAWLDCRFSLATHDAGLHAWTEACIPGASHLHMEHDLAGDCTGRNGRHPLPTRADFQSSLQQAGVNAAQTIIVYDDQRLAGAARAWWLLRYFGVTDVYVLDGGFAAWRADGRPVNTDMSKSKCSGDVTLSTENRSSVVTQSDVAALVDTTSSVLIDAREPQRFAGQEEPIDPIAGRIPSAANFPWTEVTNSAGFVQPQHWHETRWKTVNTDVKPVFYCGSGITASVNLLSMAIAGRNDGRLYAGSYSEWCANPDNAIERDS